MSSVIFEYQSTKLGDFILQAVIRAMCMDRRFRLQ